MFLRLLALIICLVPTLNGCAGSQPLSVDEGRTLLAKTWQADQHVVWEIDWPAAPVGQPLTVETWRTGDRYRYEILEATAPALVGETLVFDGDAAWSYNRFTSEPPIRISPILSPVTDAFAALSGLIVAPPVKATQRLVRLEHGSAQEVTLTYPAENGSAGQTLILWRDAKSGLPARIRFSAGGTEATLQARFFEPLPDPPEGLFDRPGLNQRRPDGALEKD